LRFLSFTVRVHFESSRLDTMFCAAMKSGGSR